MQSPQASTTPLELQSRILEGLLSAGHKARNTHPSPLTLPLDDVIPAVLKAFCPSALTGTLRTVGQKQTSGQEWNSKDHGRGVLVTFGDSQSDDCPVSIVFDGSLLASLLSITIGGKTGISATGRPVSKMEIKLAYQIAPALPDALKPMLRTRTSHFDIKVLSPDLQDTYQSETALHSFEFELEFCGVAYPIPMAIPDVKIERRTTHLPASPTKTKGQSALAEIERAPIQIEILAILHDQTLESLNKLSVGEFLPMSRTCLDEAILNIRNQTLFVGQIGRSGEQYCFRVARAHPSGFQISSHGGP